MVGLPNEIIHTIIHEYKQAGGFTSLVPLAAINRGWQTAVEEYTWRYLRVVPRDCGRLHSALRGNFRRRRAIKTLDIRFENCFAKEDQQRKTQDTEDEESMDTESSNEPDDAPQPGENYNDGGCPAVDSEYQTPLKRLTALRSEHARFFREVKSLWDELASWNDDLQITKIYIHVNGYSVYDFIGPAVCDGDYPGDSRLLDYVSFPTLPLLPSVKCLWVREEINEEIDLWPTIVVCSVAGSLPKLECFEAVGVEYEPRWPLVRTCLRQGKDASPMPKVHSSLTSQALANQIRNLPTSLETLYLCLEHSGIKNHEVQPPNLLVGGVDYLSKSIHHISVHLTTLAIRLSYISAAIFWDLDVSPAGSSETLTWPNLRILDISTGLERSTGDYWLRSAADYPHHPRFDYPGAEDSDSEDAETEAYRKVGSWPPRRFRTRPEPDFFDELAVCISRAAAAMPKLEYFDLEFNASHQGLLEPDITLFHQGLGHRGGFNPNVHHQYEGWAFYFRASNEARFASKYPKLYWFEHEPGLDRTEIERPRTEWVFQCPYGEVQWEEPEAAKALWREKRPQIDSDLVTLGEGGRAWERRRNGELVPLLGEGFRTKFSGRPDLLETIRAVD
jgi:hypothetical protein